MRAGVEKSINAIKECTSRAYSVLVKSNNALEAVIEAVKCMEDSGYLNAGAGSVPNLLGERELDAGLMTSKGLIGAVAAVKATRNPILLARIVAEKTPHVLLAGENADRLALLYDLPPLPPTPSHVLERYREALLKLRSGELSDRFYVALREFIESNNVYKRYIYEVTQVHDTVGAVAIDDNGMLAAATSTGGVMLKLPGRVGDTPILGAGFYASEFTACSATGIGEYIIRTMPCLRIDIEYRNERDIMRSISKVHDFIENNVGSNTMGLIGVDRDGDIFYMYNTEAMLVGYVKNGEVYVDLKPEPKINVISHS